MTKLHGMPASYELSEEEVRGGVLGVVVGGLGRPRGRGTLHPTAAQWLEPLAFALQLAALRAKCTVLALLVCPGALACCRCGSCCLTWSRRTTSECKEQGLAGTPGQPHSKQTACDCSCSCLGRLPQSRAPHPALMVRFSLPPQVHAADQVGSSTLWLMARQLVGTMLSPAATTDCTLLTSAQMNPVPVQRYVACNITLYACSSRMLRGWQISRRGHAGLRRRAPAYSRAAAAAISRL